MSDVIARLQVTLDGVEPEVTRRLDVPFDMRLDRLHLTLQAALGWTNTHLWEFRVGETGWGLPDPDWPDGPLDGRKATLFDVIEDTGAKTLCYLYDFGDGWQHTIKIQDLDDADPATDYPVLLDASGRCPPEDVGGPWGYEEFLEALADPDHESHDMFTEWWAGDFDPKAVPIQELKTAVAALAKRWNRRPRKKQPS